MKFYVCIAANVRAYAGVEIEAKDEEAAWARAKALASATCIFQEPEMEDVLFEPEWDTLDDFEALDGSVTLVKGETK
jgi:tRNA/tmRNA/rRNA uracil-C5-methylase (TrmA/RlmC/RlmD family)